MKDYDRWFVSMEVDGEGGDIYEFDRAQEVTEFIQKYAPCEPNFRVIYGREFEIKVTEEKKVELV